MILVSLLPIFKMFSVPTKTNSRRSNSSGSKHVFEKLRYGDKLVWTVGLTVGIKLRFQNFFGVGA